MVIGYVLVDTNDSKERKIAHDLKKITNVKEVDKTLVEETAMADPLFENYNLIVKLEADSIDQMEEIVNKRIHKIPGINKVILSNKPHFK